MEKIKTYIALAIIALLAIGGIVIWGQSKKIDTLKNERDRYKTNTEILSTDCERYRTADSLSAARVKALTLDLEEYERLRAADAQLINSLKAKNRELRSVNETQVATIIELSSKPKDTVIVKDGGEVQAVAVHCGDEWYNFDGVLTADEFTGKLINRDSLLIMETVQYKRFLNFLWKTHKVKDRQLNALSRNPHTEIQDVSFVVIEK